MFLTWISPINIHVLNVVKRENDFAAFFFSEIISKHSLKIALKRLIETYIINVLWLKDFRPPNSTELNSLDERQTTSVGTLTSKLLRGAIQGNEPQSIIINALE